MSQAFEASRSLTALELSHNLVFQPLADGKPAGRYVVFADGFAGAVKEPGQAAHRPSGLAMAPDGALYISDDQHGRIWRVTYRGPATAAVAAASAPPAARSSTAPAEPPEGIHPGAGAAGCRPPPRTAGDNTPAGRAGRSHLPRPSRRCSLRGMPRNECQGHAAGT
jgi:hypothetical protein